MLYNDLNASEYHKLIGKHVNSSELQESQLDISPSHSTGCKNTSVYSGVFFYLLKQYL